MFLLVLLWNLFYTRHLGSSENTLKKNTFQQKFQFEVRCPFTKLNTWKAPITCSPLMCCHVLLSSLHRWYLEVNKVQLTKFFLLYPIIFHPSPTPCRFCFSPTVLWVVGQSSLKSSSLCNFGWFLYNTHATALSMPFMVKLCPPSATLGTL